MGYQINLKVEKLHDQFVAKPQSGIAMYGMNYYKTELLATVMRGVCDDETIRAIYTKIALSISGIVYEAQREWKDDLQKYHVDDDGTYYFCGWEFFNGSGARSIDEISNSATEKLVLYATSKSYDIIADQDAYWEKYEFVKGIIDDIAEEVYNSMSHTFVDFYRDNEVKQDDNDDDNIDGNDA